MANNNITFSTHQRIRRSMEAKRKAAEQEKLEPDFDTMKMDELQAYAKGHDIDVSGLRKKDDIKNRILAAKDVSPEKEASAENEDNVNKEDVKDSNVEELTDNDEVASGDVTEAGDSDDADSGAD